VSFTSTTGNEALGIAFKNFLAICTKLKSFMWARMWRSQQHERHLQRCAGKKCTMHPLAICRHCCSYVLNVVVSGHGSSRPPPIRSATGIAARIRVFISCPAQLFCEVWPNQTETATPRRKRELLPPCETFRVDGHDPVNHVLLV